MVQIFSVIFFALIVVGINVLFGIFVVPKVQKLIRDLLKGELFLSILDMFMGLFVLSSITFLLLSALIA